MTTIDKKRLKALNKILIDSDFELSHQVTFLANAPYKFRFVLASTKGIIYFEADTLEAILDDVIAAQAAQSGEI